MISEPARGRSGPDPAERTSTSPVLLVGADGTPCGQAAMRAAARLAARMGMTVVVGHVATLLRPPIAGEPLRELREDLEFEVLTQASAVFDPVKVTWRFAVTSGDAAQGLHHLADRYDASLVVVGTRGGGLRNTFHRILHGSVSSHLVRHERRPVLVVPLGGETRRVPA